MTGASTSEPGLASGLTIDFAIVGHGWMECSFAVEGDPAVTVTASYLSDVIGDFLGLAMSIATGWTKAGAVVLQREPEGSVVTCLVRGGAVDVSILSSDDAGDVGEAAFRVAVPQLVTAITDAVDRIDRDVYREEWGQFDFPDTRLRQLREYLSGPGADAGRRARPGTPRA